MGCQVKHRHYDTDHHTLQGMLGPLHAPALISTMNITFMGRTEAFVPVIGTLRDTPAHKAKPTPPKPAVPMREELARVHLEREIRRVIGEHTPGVTWSAMRADLFKIEIPPFAPLVEVKFREFGGARIIVTYNPFVKPEHSWSYVESR